MGLPEITGASKRAEFPSRRLLSLAIDQRGVKLMLETGHSLSLLALMEIAGPIVLACGLIYGIFVASRRRGGKKSAGDAATRRLYQQKDDEIK
jgi:hypothetical protein